MVFDLETCNNNVIIDVSSPEGTEKLLQKLISIKSDVPVVIGTTGTMPEELISKYSGMAPVAVVSNFSEGIPLFLRFMDSIDREYWKPSMWEAHHVHKKDAPSGTAKTLATTYGGIRFEDIKSHREGEIVGKHQLVLDNDFEKITILHEAKDRSVFAVGAIRWAKWLSQQKPGLYYEMVVHDSELYFDRYSGAGNEFVIVDNTWYQFNANQRINHTVKLCGFTGADGAIFVDMNHDNEEVDIYAKERGIDLTKVPIWRFYNKDGSNVEMCGNGARCVGRWLVNNQWCESRGLMTNCTDAGTFEFSQFHVEDSGVTIQMPKVSEIDGITVCGVPHKVITFETTDTVTDIQLKLEDTFKEMEGKCNVTGVQQIDGGIKTWTCERGVGEITGACGTGCVSSAYEYRSSSTDEPNVIECEVPSGDHLTVKFEEDTPFLTGPAKLLFSGKLPL